MSKFNKYLEIVHDLGRGEKSYSFEPGTSKKEVLRILSNVEKVSEDKIDIINFASSGDSVEVAYLVDK